jgi:hypothetical protein
MQEDRCYPITSVVRPGKGAAGSWKEARRKLCIEPPMLTGLTPLQPAYRPPPPTVLL